MRVFLAHERSKSHRVYSKEDEGSIKEKVQDQSPGGVEKESAVSTKVEEGVCNLEVSSPNVELLQSSVICETYECCSIEDVKLSVRRREWRSIPLNVFLA
ncbi:hypothetical protein L6452_17993 [Arctium lappa]|uniref:Uncharacterized protein n=1 Tax=Arctium lappa TaxID=4217 RepID=A0ACB9C4Y8_ARCLA|nr:hypothetical protein L6452_17993 [Arctium lappa]